MLHSTEIFHAEARSGDQELVLLGVSEHFNSPSHPQLDAITDRWKSFVTHNPQAPVAVLEGDIPEPRLSHSPLRSDEELALRVGGEVGLLSTLAYKIQADLSSGEPQSHSDVSELLQLTDAANIDRTVVGYYYWARNIPFWMHEDPQPPLEEFFDPNTDAGRNRLPSEDQFGFDFSYETMLLTHKKLYGTAFDPETLTFDNKDIQTIAWLLQDVRDLHLGRTIVRLWSEGRSPFVLYPRKRLQNWPVQECLAKLPNYHVENSL